MSPGGHLVTTVAACAITACATGSAELTAAVATGGFLIDVDHAVDYVLFERQQDLRPSAFLQYYLEGRVQRAVLVLHSYEVFALLGLVAWWWSSALIGAYLVGAVMHLALDIVFNGRLVPHSIAAFYSFGYRLAHGFDARTLLGIEARPLATPFWVSFFRGVPSPAPPARAERIAGRVPDPLA